MALGTAFRAVMQHTVEVYKVDTNVDVEDDRGNRVNGKALAQTLSPTDVSVDPGGSGCRVEPVFPGRHREIGDFAEIAVGDYTFISPPEADVATEDTLVWIMPLPGGGTARRAFNVFAVLHEADVDGSIHHFEFYGREVDIP